MAELMRIEGAGGRGLEVEVDGPEDGQLLLFHNGTPAAGRLFEPHVRAGAARGLRHVTYSRPGYGASDRQAGRSVADCAEDVRAIADALGAERLLLAGASGGGPHALACAALLPERVAAVASIAGVAPAAAAGLDWEAGMGEENLEEFAAARSGEEALRSYLEPAARELESASGADLLPALGDLLSDVDRAALSGEFAEYLATCMSAAVSRGIWGWFDDDIAFMGPWGFELASIEVPVAIWQGRRDRFVPYAHGEWLAAHVPGARSRLSDEHGHLSLTLDAYGDVLDDLLASAR